MPRAARRGDTLRYPPVVPAPPPTSVRVIDRFASTAPTVLAVGQTLALSRSPGTDGRPSIAVTDRSAGAVSRGRVTTTWIGTGWVIDNGTTRPLAYRPFSFVSDQVMGGRSRRTVPFARIQLRWYSESDLAAWVLLEPQDADDEAFTGPRREPGPDETADPLVSAYFGLRNLVPELLPAALSIWRDHADWPPPRRTEEQAVRRAKELLAGRRADGGPAASTVTRQLQRLAESAHRYGYVHPRPPSSTTTAAKRQANGILYDALLLQWLAERWLVPFRLSQDLVRELSTDGRPT